MSPHRRHFLFCAEMPTMDFDFSRPIVLENERAVLRPLLPDDVRHLQAAATADADLVQFSPYSIHTPELLAAYISTSQKEKENGVRYALAIYDKAAGQWAGSTSLANISNKDQRLEIGWTWIGKAFQQTGLNRACKFLLLRYVFDELQFERVEFKTDARNLASRTAIQKIGGQYEGALRSHTLMPDGFRRTTVYYSILKNEWPGLKTTVFAHCTNLENEAGSQR